MEKLQAVQAILAAIDALPESARQRLVVEMYQRGYLTNLRQPRSETPTTPTLTGASKADGNPTGSARNYRLQLGSEANGTIFAILAGWEGCRAFGRTRLEAVRNLRHLIGAQIANINAVTLQPVGDAENAAKTERNTQQHQKILAYLDACQQRLATTPLESSDRPNSS